MAGVDQNQKLRFRAATGADLPAIVRLLAEDDLGAAREHFADPLPAAYRDAFEAMQVQGGNDCLLAELDGELAGCLQLTVIPGLSRLGMRRAQIEGVRVDRRFRGQGIGAALFQHAIDRAREAGCGIVQLTTDKTRPGALRFYERLGFAASHEGLKLALN